MNRANRAARVRVPTNTTGKADMKEPYGTCGSAHHDRRTLKWVLDKHWAKMASGLNCLIKCHEVGPCEPDNGILGFIRAENFKHLM
jgi:hypothetical protein